MISIEAVHALRGLSLGILRFEPQPDVNTFDDQDIVLQFHLAHGV